MWVHDGHDSGSQSYQATPVVSRREPNIVDDIDLDRGESGIVMGSLSPVMQNGCSHCVLFTVHYVFLVWVAFCDP